MSRHRIVIVVGKPDDIRLLDLFEPLTKTSDVTACVIQHEDALNHYRSPVKIKVFRDIPDMPGYMRGLDDEIASADIIIALETSRLSTFQATRAALKLSKPILVLVQETVPFFYSNLQNIRAVQTDILESATGFIATSAAAQEMLLVEGVQPGKIKLMLPAICVSQFQPDQRLREKFRGYVGMGKDDFVALFKDDLHPTQQPQEILGALRIVQAKNPQAFANLKVVFAGVGPLADELKYQAYDQGLGKHVFFLHQNTEPFLRDLFCAADILLTARETGPRTPKRWLLEAASVGCVPALQGNSPVVSWLEPHCATFTEMTPMNVAELFQHFLNNSSDLAARRNGLREKIALEFDANQRLAELTNIIEGHLEGVPYEIKRQKNDFAKSYQEAGELIAQGQHGGGLQIIEELLKLQGNQPSMRADLSRLKGDALLGQGHFEKASEVYGEAVSLDDQNWQAYLGLAQVAYTSHANEESLKLYKKVLARNSNNYKALLGIGLIYRRAKMNEEALFWLMKALSFQGPDKKAVFALAQACLESENDGLAIHVLERALDTVGEDNSLTLALGQIYLRYGMIERGKELLAKGMSQAMKVPTAS